MNVGEDHGNLPHTQAALGHRDPLLVVPQCPQAALRAPGSKDCPVPWPIRLRHSDGIPVSPGASAFECW